MAPRDPLYLEDLAPGQRFTSDAHTVDEVELIAFATRFDPQPFHVDAAAARDTFFGELVASGWHTAGITMRLQVDSGPPIAGGLVGAGGRIEWPQPTRAGDTLHVETEILEVRASRSKPDRGLVTMVATTRNQRGEAVQTFSVTLVVPRRTRG